VTGFDVPWWARPPIAAGIAWLIAIAGQRLPTAGEGTFAGVLGSFTAATLVAAAHPLVADLGRRRDPRGVVRWSLGFGLLSTGLELVHVLLVAPLVFLAAGALAQRFAAGTPGGPGRRPAFIEGVVAFFLSGFGAFALRDLLPQLQEAAAYAATVTLLFWLGIAGSDALTRRYPARERVT
jgi:hypothetical protein